MELVEINQVKLAALKRVQQQEKELNRAQIQAQDRVDTIKSTLREVTVLVKGLQDTVVWYQKLEACLQVRSVFIRADKPSSIYFTIDPITIVLHKDKDKEVADLVRAEQPVPLIELKLPVSRGTLFIWNHKQFIANKGKTGGTLTRVINQRTHHYENPVTKRPLSRYPHPTVDGQGRPCWGEIKEDGMNHSLGNKISRLMRSVDVDGLVTALYSYLEQDPNWIHRETKNSRKTPFRIAAVKTKDWKREIIGEIAEGQTEEPKDPVKDEKAADFAQLDEIIRAAGDVARRQKQRADAVFGQYAPINWKTTTGTVTDDTTDTEVGNPTIGVGTDALPREEGEG